MAAVPGLMLDIGANVARMQQDMRKITGTMESGFGQMRSAAMKLGGVLISVFAGRQIISGIGAMIDAAQQQEAAEKKLETAIGYTSKALLEQASALQKITTYADETIVDLQAMIGMFVRDEEQIKEATKATMDLAAAKGMDLRTAGDLVSKSLGSSTNALSRYGIEIKGAVGSSERLSSLTKNIANVFGGQAVAATQTFAGKIAQLKNIWGDLLERFGDVIIKSPAVAKAIDYVVRVIIDLSENMPRIIDDVKSLLSIFKDLWDVLISAPVGIFDYFVELTKQLKDAEQGVISLQNKLTEESNWIKFMVFMNEWGKNITYFFEFMGKAIGEFAALLVVDMYAALKAIWGYLEQTGRLLVGIFTLDTEAIKNSLMKGFGDVTRTAYAEINIAYNTFLKTLGKSWDEMGDKMAQTPALIKAISGEIKKGIPKTLIPIEVDDKATQAIRKQIDALLLQAETLGWSEKQAKLWTLAHTEGITPALYAEAESILELIETYKSQIKFGEYMIAQAKQEQDAIEANQMAIYNQIDAMKMQVNTFGMSEKAAALYRMKLEGATDAQIILADEIMDTVAALKLFEETRTPIERFEKELGKLNELFAKGKISTEVFERAYLGMWDKILGVGDMVVAADEKAIANREQILLDFSDRFRKLTLGDSQYAIAQIEEQARIFRNAGADQVAVAILTAHDKLKASRKWEDGAIRGLQNYSDKATNMALQVEDVVTNVFKEMENVLVEFAMTGKASFKDFSDFIIKEMIRIMIQSQITGPLAGAAKSWLSGLWSTPSAGAGSMGGEYGATEYSMGVAHKGGIVGMTSFPTRSMPESIFNNAPRLHSGMRYDEYPAILQRGEGVFTPEQMRAMGKTEVNVNVVNQSSQVQADVQETGDGRGNKDISVIISEIAGAEAGRRGSPLNNRLRTIGSRNPLIRR